MEKPFLGSEALASGVVTSHALRTRYDALHKDVYLLRGAKVTATTRASAAWLWSRRKAVIAGRSAAALHRAKWIDSHAPAEILFDNRRPTAGVHCWSDRIEDDEITLLDGMRVTTAARTALDYACRYPLDQAVTAIDALANASPSQAGRRRDHCGPVHRSPRNPECPARNRSGGRRCAVTTRDLVAPPRGPRRVPKTPDSGARAQRVRRHHRPPRSGMGGRQDRARIRGSAPPPQSRAVRIRHSQARAGAGSRVESQPSDVDGSARRDTRSSSYAVARSPSVTWLRRNELKAAVASRSA